MKPKPHKKRHKKFYENQGLIHPDDRVRTDNRMLDMVHSGVMDELVKLVGNGMKVKDACEYLGITYAQYYAFTRDNYHMRVKVNNAKMKFKLHHIANVSQAGGRDWKASAWILERKFPDEYGKNINININKKKQLPSWFGKPMIIEDAEIVNSEQQSFDETTDDGIDPDTIILNIDNDADTDDDKQTDTTDKRE